MKTTIINNLNMLIYRNLYSYRLNRMQRGKFIVLQGLDRSGKSSVTKYIKTVLSESHPTVSKSYPDRTTPIGLMINQFLLNKSQLSAQAIHLLFSANRWQTQQCLKQTLNSGNNIVCDRYWYSGVAYSFAKGLDFQWCAKSDQGLLTPDLVIYLSANPEDLSQRHGYGEERFQRIDFQKKVHQAFDRMFQKIDQNKLAIVDITNKNLQQVQNQVRNVLKQKLDI